VVDELFSRGGMASMLTTVWLILGALSYAAVMEHAGFLQRLNHRTTGRRGNSHHRLPQG
jgi:Na+/H+ antiporter NhaC